MKTHEFRPRVPAPLHVFPFVLAAIGVLWLTACGGMFNPPPTTRAVTVTDLVGNWSYQASTANSANVVINLRQDGTYTQTVTRPAGVLTASGTWSINGSDVSFASLYVDFDNWKVAEEQVWQIIDGDESPTGFAILGGAVDPDLWVIMEWTQSPSAE